MSRFLGKSPMETTSGGGGASLTGLRAFQHARDLSRHLIADTSFRPDVHAAPPIQQLRPEILEHLGHLTTMSPVAELQPGTA